MVSVNVIGRPSHACFAVNTLEEAKEVWSDVLGFQQDTDRPHVFHVNNVFVIHACAVEPLAVELSGWEGFPEIRTVHDPTTWASVNNHIALETNDLNHLASVLLNAELRPFQMDERGNRHDICADSLECDFGMGSVFFYDLSGNLFEFGEVGRGEWE